MIERQLVFLDFQAKDSEDFLNRISHILYKKHYVKDTFKEAIKKREEKFPTGLELETLKVAIPHTDSIHVLKPRVVFVRFKTPIDFKRMDGKGNIKVSMAFVLLVTNKINQLPLLQKLIEILSNNEVIERLGNENEENIIKILGDELL